jgi:hypothetical protein
MAKKPMTVGRFLWPDPNPHVGLNDTFTITFHHSGTFCSPDAGNFTPSLPDDQFFEENATWPDSGVATPSPNYKPKTRYHFHRSSTKEKCKQPPKGGSLSGYHVIHIP